MNGVFLYPYFFDTLAKKNKIMPSDCVSYEKSGFFTSLMVDYLNQKPELNSLYNHFPSIENFKKQIEEKKKSFSNENRIVLHEILLKQYHQIETSSKTKENIEALLDRKTFTVTTGHQLNLFTGPLYFLYKIISTINSCEALKNKYHEHHFVPIYWMATEDHDFEEINYFQFKGTKIQWDRESTGAVGNLATEGLDVVLDFFKKKLGSGANAKQLMEWFESAYLNHTNLADATRYLANELFGKYGLVILDANEKELKKLLIPYIKEEILHQSSFQKVNDKLPYLEQYLVQVNPREINLFYMEKGLRERIVFDNDVYKVLNTNLSFSKSQMLDLIESSPEKFSPNVILRPLYQEIILPNLCYIGGGGELAYWLELKAVFEHNSITFPILLLRNSVLLVTQKQKQKAAALELTWEDLFLKSSMLKHKKTLELSAHKLDFSAQKEHLKSQFDALLNMSFKTHKSFLGAVKAQERKQIKGLEHLEKRLIKAEMKIQEDALQRILFLKNELFPKDGLQERVLNFSEFYENYGFKMIENLKNNLNPFSTNFHIETLAY